MNSWFDPLSYDPIHPLLESENAAITYFTKRDLLGETVPLVQTIWSLSEIQRTLKKQNQDGSWKFSGKKIPVYPSHHYALIATFKVYRDLIEKYKLNATHPACQNASEYILSCQTEEGDIRGMIGNQYATYYTGYILSLLIKAGYTNDSRIIKGMEWLLSMRQHDGGWSIPMLTHYLDRKTTHQITTKKVEPVKPDTSQPSSHTWTNMVLQAFSIHPKYKQRDDIRKAASIVKSRFFKKDVYNSYKSEYYWTRFISWWPNLLTSLISLHHLGFNRQDPDILKGLEWFIRNQQSDGLWNLEHNPTKRVTINKKTTTRRLWLTLNICRMLRHYS